MVWDFGNPQKIEQTKNIHYYEEKKNQMHTPPPPHNRYSAIVKIEFMAH